MATYQNLPNFNGLQVGDIIEYTYTGAVFPIVVKKGTYKITTYGAQGGYRSSATYGGQGGSAIGIWTNETNNRTAFVYVGGSGNTGGQSGGFNGGGDRQTNPYPGGGGASDMRLDTDSLYHRLIVGGGGASDGASNKGGAVGGGTTGEDNTSKYGTGGQGGTQTAGGGGGNNNSGTFGQGGTGLYRGGGNGGAGGGGWYGGGGAYPDGSGDDDRGGGGGSGFTWTNQALTLPTGGVWGLTSADALTSTTLTQGGRTGDGLVTIEILEMPQTYKLATDGTDTYGFAGEQWEVVIESNRQPDVEDFLEYGIQDIPNFEGLPANSHLLIYDPDQNDDDYELSITSNPTTQVVTTKMGIALPFSTTAEQPYITKQVSGGTAEITNWSQAGNKVHIEITMTKPSLTAMASVSEIKVPFHRGG